MLSERDFISQIQGRCSGNKLVKKGIGDDCAVFRIADGETAGLISTDTLVEGVHFDLAWHPPKRLGHKAAAVNLSDIAAMGGVPLFALLSVAAPIETDGAVLDEFMSGFVEELQGHNVALIGGDTVKSGNEISFGVTVVGRPGGRIIYRSGAKPGDLIWVSRPLGEAAAGLALCKSGASDTIEKWPTLVAAHLQPVAEVELGQLLAASGLVHAMIDMSDGLATDLAQLCKESKVGAKLSASQIPVSSEMCRAAEEIKVSSQEWALSGGEDYCLLFISSRSAKKELQDLVSEKLGREMYCVGEVVSGGGVFLEQKGVQQEVSFAGYDHFAL